MGRGKGFHDRMWSSQETPANFSNGQLNAYKEKTVNKFIYLVCFEQNTRKYVDCEQLC